MMLSMPANWPTATSKLAFVRRLWFLYLRPHADFNTLEQISLTCRTSCIQIHRWTAKPPREEQRYTWSTSALTCYLPCLGQICVLFVRLWKGWPSRRSGCVHMRPRSRKPRQTLFLSSGNDARCRNCERPLLEVRHCIQGSIYLRRSTNPQR